MMWGRWPGMMGGYFEGFEFIWIIFISLFAAAIIAGVIILIIWAVKKTGTTQQVQQVAKNVAIKILEERYVKGEISKEEFDNIKKDIS